jgi:hypothetical protein
MYWRVGVCAFVFVCVFVILYACECVHICVCACVCERGCVCTCVGVYVCVCARPCVCVCRCLCVCLRVWVCLCIAYHFGLSELHRPLRCSRVYHTLRNQIWSTIVCNSPRLRIRVTLTSVLGGTVVVGIESLCLLHVAHVYVDRRRALLFIPHSRPLYITIICTHTPGRSE